MAAKMATPRRRRGSANSWRDILTAIGGFWPVWTAALLLLALSAAFRWWPASWSLANITARYAPKSMIGDAVRVQVLGDLKYLSVLSVQARVKKAMRSGVMSSNLSQLRDALLQEPWIADVTIKRRNPEELDVFVWERKPVAYWRDKGLIDANGEIFEPQNRPIVPGLKHIDTRPEEVATGLKLMHKAVATNDRHFPEVAGVGTDILGTWRLRLQNGEEWVLGRRDLENRMRRIVSLRQRIMRQGHPAYVDARYTNGVAVRYVVTADKKGQ